MAIQRQAAPLREQAVVELRQRIIDGTYRPGARLIERRLEEDLGVSRTVVREALRQLESQRLIYLKPNVGPIVNVLTYEDAVHLYQVRAALEGAAARLASEQATKEDVALLRELIGRLSRTSDSPDVQKLIQQKNDFYNALLGVAGNPVIEELLENIQARISVLRSYTLNSPGRLTESRKEISAVIDAIEAHDPDLAEAQTRHHVRSAQAIALNHFAELDFDRGVTQ